MIIAQMDLTYLILAAAVVLLMTALRSWNRQAREAAGAMVSGDFSRARDLYMRLLTGRSLGARFLRWRNRGLLEANVAAMFVCLGRDDEALEFVHRGLRSKPVSRAEIILRHVAVQVCANAGDQAGLDEHLAALARIARGSSSSQQVYHAHAIGRYHEIGRLDLAAEALRTALNEAPDGDGAALAPRVAALLAVLGRFEDVFRLVECVVPPCLPQGRTAIDAEARDLKQFFSQANRAELLIDASEAASLAARPDLQDIYASALSGNVGSLPMVRVHALGQRARLAAARMDRALLEETQHEMDALVDQYQENCHLPLIRAYHLGQAYRHLGDAARAIDELRQALQRPFPPVQQSLIHSAIGACASDLGNEEEATFHRNQAAALAPLAHWNGPPPLEPSLSAALDRYLELSQSCGRLEPRTSLDPVPPVASRLACASWGLGVLSLTPFFGALFGLILAPVSLVLLLLRRSRLAHDRKVGLAGLVFAFLSIGFPLAVIAIPGRVWFKPTATSPASAIPLAELIEGAATDEPPATQETDEGELMTPEDARIMGDDQEDLFDDEEEDDLALESEAGWDESEPGWELTWLDHVILVAVLIISVMLHEIGHAVAAYWAGDPTARDQKRFSLNPLRHVDPVGSVIFPAILAFAGSPVVGWAKPVPISPVRFRRPRLGALGVSLAGVSLNILLALLAANLLSILLAALARSDGDFFLAGRLAAAFEWRIIGTAHPEFWQVLLQVLVAFVLVNAVLAGFNLLPFPPLDGFAALRALLPGVLDRLAGKFANLGFILLLCTLIFGWITYLLLPGMLAGLTLLAAARGLAGV